MCIAESKVGMFIILNIENVMARAEK